MSSFQVQLTKLALDLTANEFNSEIQCATRQSPIEDPIQSNPKSRRPAYTPYSVLTPVGIRFGYFESLVVPSSNQAKETITGGTQSGSLAAKSEYVSPMTFRKYRNSPLSSDGRLEMRVSKTASDFFQESYPSPSFESTLSINMRMDTPQ